jgi:hypothetical protein
MIGVHSRAAAMKSFSRFIIFIRSSLLVSRVTRCGYICIVERLPEQSAFATADFPETRPVLGRTKLSSQSLQQDFSLDEVDAISQPMRIRKLAAAVWKPILRKNAKDGATAVSEKFMAQSQI